MICYTGGSRMTKGRDTTYEGRIALVKECIGNGYNYTEIAQKNQVRYQQIYTWVQKYKKDGEEGGGEDPFHVCQRDDYRRH